MDLPSRFGCVLFATLNSMNTRLLALAAFTLLIGTLPPLAATAVPATAIKPGYNVIVEVAYDETGKWEASVITESDDNSHDTVLDRYAVYLSNKLPKQEPRLKDGQPTKFKVRVPYNFPVEGDEGPAANQAPRPTLNKGTRPIFPEALGVKGESGGALLELSIGSFGNVQSVKVLRSSHQEFADAAVAAANSWIFIPAQKDGIYVESRWRIAIRFALQGKFNDWWWCVAPRPSLGDCLVEWPKPAADTPANAAAATPTTAASAPTAMPAK